MTTYSSSILDRSVNPVQNSVVFGNSLFFLVSLIVDLLRDCQGQELIKFEEP